MLAFYDERHRPACASCTGNDPIYACVQCGREDCPFGRSCCVRMRLLGGQDKITRSGEQNARAIILTELLGLSPATATRWATLAARDWSQCTAMRRNADT